MTEYIDCLNEMRAREDELKEQWKRVFEENAKLRAEQSEVYRKGDPGRAVEINEGGITVTRSRLGDDKINKQEFDEDVELTLRILREIAENDRYSAEDRMTALRDLIAIRNRLG